jgi:hypothetical protein
LPTATAALYIPNSDAEPNRCYQPASWVDQTAETGFYGIGNGRWIHVIYRTQKYINTNLKESPSSRKTSCWSYLTAATDIDRYVK